MSSVICPVAHWADKNPRGTAVITGSGDISFAELHAKVAGTVEYLRKIGIVRGTRVAILLPNNLDYLIVLLALARLGAVAILLSTRLPIEAVTHLISRLSCTFLLSDHTWPHQIPDVTQIDADPIVSDAGHSDLSNCSIPLNSPAIGVFTSGSSGDPKAALLSYGNLYFNALGSSENIPFGPGDRWLLSLPLYHVGGLGILFRSLLAGGTVVIPEKGDSLPSSINGRDVTHISVVTTQLHRLLADPDNLESLRRLKAVLIGGSQISPSLITRSLEAGLSIHTSYGLTEMASQVTTTAPGEPLSRLLTAGRPLPYRRVMISSDREILVKGETLFQGYLTSSGLETPFDSNGWFATGDLGTLDGAGYLTVIGRKDNRFISGGENIQPEEVERALLEIHLVEEAVVVPVENVEYGFRPAAFVRLSPGAELNEDSLKRQLREKIPGFKIPDRILPWPHELINSGLKPSRTQLQEFARKSVS